MANSKQYNSPEQDAKIYIFSVKHITAFVHLETLASTSAICLGAILHSKNHLPPPPNKAQKCEECGTK